MMHTKETRQVIAKSGKVTITEDRILITHFHFEDPIIICANVDALLWARDRLNEEIQAFVDDRDYKTRITAELPRTTKDDDGFTWRRAVGALVLFAAGFCTAFALLAFMFSFD
jgi:hypothetical protein